MKPDPELKTLLFLERSMHKDFPSKKAIRVLEVIMFVMILIGLAAFLLVATDRLSGIVGMLITAVSGLVVGMLTYYIHSIEVWPYYQPHIDQQSVRKRLYEIRQKSA